MCGSFFGSFVTARSVTKHNKQDWSHSPIHKLHETCKSLFVHEYQLLYSVIQTIFYCVNLHNDYSSKGRLGVMIMACLMEVYCPHFLLEKLG
jgi:hypothetical protein